MPFDDSALSSKYALTRMRIRSGTQVSTRTTQVISALTTPTPDDTSPALVVLQASNRDANKLITITEIAKRDLLSKGIKVFQYTALSSQMIEIERKPTPKLPTGGDEDGEGSDDAFQTVGQADIKALGPKKRAVPVLTVYLAARPVKELKAEFGATKLRYMLSDPQSYWIPSTEPAILELSPTPADERSQVSDAMSLGTIRDEISRRGLRRSWAPRAFGLLPGTAAQDSRMPERVNAISVRTSPLHIREANLEVEHSGVHLLVLIAQWKVRCLRSCTYYFANAGVPASVAMQSWHRVVDLSAATA